MIKNCEESTKALLDKGAHVNLQVPFDLMKMYLFKCKCIFFSSFRPRVTSSSLQDETGCTALHYAIANNNIAITQLIIEAGGSLFLAGTQISTLAKIWLQIRRNKFDLTHTFFTTISLSDDQGILPTAFSKSKEMTDFLNDKIFDSTLNSKSCNFLKNFVVIVWIFKFELRWMLN